MPLTPPTNLLPMDGIEACAPVSFSWTPGQDNAAIYLNVSTDPSITPVVINIRDDGPHYYCGTTAKFEALRGQTLYWHLAGDASGGQRVWTATQRCRRAPISRQTGVGRGAVAPKRRPRARPGGRMARAGDCSSRDRRCAREVASRAWSSPARSTPVLRPRTCDNNHTHARTHTWACRSVVSGYESSLPEDRAAPAGRPSDSEPERRRSRNLRELHCGPRLLVVSPNEERMPGRSDCCVWAHPLLSSSAIGEGSLSISQ